MSPFSIDGDRLVEQLADLVRIDSLGFVLGEIDDTRDVLSDQIRVRHGRVRES